MKRLIILLILVMAIPVVAQVDKDAKPTFASAKIEGLGQAKVKTEWRIDKTCELLLQKFHIQMQEDYIELLKIIKATEMKIHPDMPETAKFNEQLQAFVITKPKEEKKDDGKQQ